MGKEPDNLVQQLLREFRQKQDEQGFDIAVHKAELRRLTQSVEDWKDTTATSSGLAFHANVKIDAVDRKIEELTQRIERLEKAK